MFAEVNLLESVSIVLADLRWDVVRDGCAVDGEGSFAGRKEGDGGLDGGELSQLGHGNCVAVDVQSGLPCEWLVRDLILMSKNMFKAKGGFEKS